MPFFDETEWDEIEKVLVRYVDAIREYREKHGCDLETARTQVLPGVERKLSGITGVADIDDLWHHRRREWGPECPRCHYLLRTPEASFCAHCGWETSSAP
jgi:hypothetical protein